MISKDVVSIESSLEKVKSIPLDSKRRDVLHEAKSVVIEYYSDGLRKAIACEDNEAIENQLNLIVEKQYQGDMSDLFIEANRILNPEVKVVEAADQDALPVISEDGTPVVVAPSKSGLDWVDSKADLEARSDSKPAFIGKTVKLQKAMANKFAQIKVLNANVKVALEEFDREKLKSLITEAESLDFDDVSIDVAKKYVFGVGDDEFNVALFYIAIVNKDVAKLKKLIVECENKETSMDKPRRLTHTFRSERNRSCKSIPFGIFL